MRVDETTKDKTIQQLRVQIEALTRAVDSLKRSGMPKCPNSWHKYIESQPQRHQQPPQQPTFEFQHPTPFLPSAMPLYNPDTQGHSQTQYHHSINTGQNPKHNYLQVDVLFKGSGSQDATNA